MQQPPESGVALIKEFEGCHERIGGDTYDLGYSRQLYGDGIISRIPRPCYWRRTVDHWLGHHSQ